MDNDKNYESSLETLRENFLIFESNLNFIVSQLQQSVCVIRDTFSIANHIHEHLSSIILKMSKSSKYFCLLKQLKWPIFLIDDETFQQDILTACAVHENADAVKEIVFAYCKDDFLKKMQDNWNNCKVIPDARKPILSEAILTHRKGCYFASTSILMCQIYGIVSDIVKFAKKNNLQADDAERKNISNFFGIAPDNIDNEKGKLLQMITMTEHRVLLWSIITEYLKDEILCSSESKNRWNTQPLRNKICHGEQLNFGTKEHSLKAILTIDILIQLAYEIQWVAEARKDD